MDQRGPYSNYGSRIDVYAPGEIKKWPNIYNNNNYITGFDYGTSYAAPLVSGLAAIYLETNPDGSNYTVRDAIRRNATYQAVTTNTVDPPYFGSMLYTNFKMNTISNAASFQRKVAPDSLAAIFGEGLNAFNGVLVENPQTNPSFIYSGNITFTSPGQINFVVPSQISTGVASFRTVVTNCQLPQCEQGHSSVIVSRIAPGLFAPTANIVSGHLLGVNKTTNALNWETLTSAGNVLRDFNTYNYYLVLYGTGFRHRNSLSNVSLQVGGVSLPPTYAGAQGSIGLDQMNVPIPITFTQRGLMDIIWSIEGQAGKIVKVRLLNP